MPFSITILSIKNLLFTLSDTPHNDLQHNNTELKGLFFYNQQTMISISTFTIMILSITAFSIMILSILSLTLSVADKYFILSVVIVNLLC